MIDARHRWLFAVCIWMLSASVGALAQDDEPTAAPGPASFATEPGELGALANSINLFTGQVSLPIPLVSLPGRDGLSVAVAASYSSAGIDIDVQTWNLGAPTGILGLGWSLDYPRIVADHKGTGTLHDDEYYLISGGSSARLIFTSDGGSYRTYTAQGNPFQRIRYYESDERWEITDEAGVISTYGDKSDANSNVQWAVRWGNYAGNSSRTSNQSQFAIAWNLSKVESRIGSAIHYDYLAVRSRVGGSGGQLQTEASYLQKIKDTFGRTVTFFYSTKDSGEYVEPHTEILGGQEDEANGDAYQEQYETKYLDRIEVKSEHGVPLFSLEMGYRSSHLNECGTSCDKRLLTSITHLNADGDALPSIDFTYTLSGSRAGFLSGVTTTSGARLDYEYADQTLDHSDLDLTINAPNDFKEPRVWIGEDYVVVSWRKPSNGNVKIRAYRWEGEWLEDTSFPTFRADRPEETDLQEFDVHIERDFFAVVAQTPSNDEHQLFLYHKDETSRDGWVSSSGIEVWDYEWDKQRVATGNNYAAAPIDVSGVRKIATFSWNGESWRQQTHRNLHNFSVFQIAGGPDYFISIEGSGVTQVPTRLYVFYRDDVHEWQSVEYADNLDDEAESYDIQTGPTFITLSASGNVNTNQIYSWDEEYTSVSRRWIDNLDNVSVRIGGPSTVGFYGTPLTVQVARYDGENWDVYDFTPSQTHGGASFSFGENYAVRQDESGAGGQRLLYDANSANWNATLVNLPSSNHSPPFEEFPRASIGNHLLGRDAYFRSPGSWGNDVALPLSGAGIDTKSARQAGAVAVVYETDGTSQGDTNVLPIRNGSFQPATVLASGRIRNIGNSSTGHLDRSELVGPGTIVTFPRSIAANLFHTVTELTLYRLVNDKLSGAQTRPVVSEITTDDGYDDRMVQFEYEQALSTIDALGRTPQFNKVVVTPRDPNNMALEPAGHVEHQFFTGYETNGVHPSETQMHPSLQDVFLDGSDNSTDYRSLIQGMPYSVRSYDGGGLISNACTIWTVFERWAGDEPVEEDNHLVRFIRPSATFVNLTSTVLEQGSVNVYTNTGSTEVKTGLVEFTYALDQTAVGDDILIETDLTYWWEEYDTDLSEHLYAPVIAERTKVGSKVVSSTATTWKDDWDGGFDDWAPEESYVWLGTAASVFPWGSTPGSQWLRTSLITERDDYGNVLEAEDVEGRPSATKYEHEGGLAVASFGNARGDETFADDFDDRVLDDGEPGSWYSNSTDWSLDGTLHWTNLGATGVVATNSAIDQVDFIAEFTMRIDDHGTGQHMGFQFRKDQPWHDPGESGYFLKLKENGTLRLEHASRGVLDSATISRPHDWNRVRVACEGQAIRVYVNGEIVISVNDTGYAPTGTYAGFLFYGSRDRSMISGCIPSTRWHPRPLTITT